MYIIVDLWYNPLHRENIVTIIYTVRTKIIHNNTFLLINDIMLR